MNVSVVAPEERVWSGDADMVVARSPEGEFAILNGHIPFLAVLVPGPVKVVSGDTREVFLIHGGLLEASGTRDDYHVIVLADAAEAAGDIDLGEARRRLEDARRAMEDQDERAEAEMRVALARVEIAERESH